MQTTDPKALKDCLAQPALGNLVKRVQLITSIKKILNGVLPSELTVHCQVLNIDNGILTLAGDSAAFVTRIRYLVPELMDALNSNDSIPTVTHISCRVIPTSFKRTAPTKQYQRFLSANTLLLLQETAKNINHDQLKKSLQQLGSVDNSTMLAKKR